MINHRQIYGVNFDHNTMIVTVLMLRCSNKGIINRHPGGTVLDYEYLSMANSR